jgi:hypothetical protein
LKFYFPIFFYLEEKLRIFLKFEKVNEWKPMSIPSLVIHLIQGLVCRSMKSIERNIKHISFGIPCQLDEKRKEFVQDIFSQSCKGIPFDLLEEPIAAIKAFNFHFPNSSSF